MGEGEGFRGSKERPGRLAALGIPGPGAAGSGCRNDEFQAEKYGKILKIRDFVGRPASQPGQASQARNIVKNAPTLAK